MEKEMQTRSSTTRFGTVALAALLALAPVAAPALADGGVPAKPVESETLKPVTDALKTGAVKAGQALDSAGEAIGDAAEVGADKAKQAGEWTAEKGEQVYEEGKEAVQEATD